MYDMNNWLSYERTELFASANALESNRELSEGREEKAVATLSRDWKDFEQIVCIKMMHFQMFPSHSPARSQFM